MKDGCLHSHQTLLLRSMCSFARALVVVSLFAAPFFSGAQVAQNTNYQSELQHVESLLAGNTASDIAHHIHYDLKLYDRNGHETTATYDIYRDPVLYTRVDVKAGDYSLTHIVNQRDHQDWLKSSGQEPLKIFDFEQVLDRPQDAINRFSQEISRVQQMHPGQLDNAPTLCAEDQAGTSICFNPLIRLFSYAQMFNQTVMYDQWLPIGSHTVPGSIRIYQDKKLLVDATGTVEAVDKFPPGLMQIPDSPSQPDSAGAHKILHSKPIDMSLAVYGNTQIAVSADEKGHVKKAEVIDADDKQIEGVARKAAKNMILAPQIENGQQVPFDTVLYLNYYPQ